MWNDKSVTLVLPTYRERDSIRRVLEDFLRTGLIDEIIVVDNNAEEGTDEELRRIEFDRLTILHEERQGYGFALRKGLLAATGDLIVSIEPDGTYVGRDMRRFLVFSDDFPVVLGSRTIHKTRNKDWGFWRREANILCGMMIHVLFQTNTITDIGCTYKLLHRDVLPRLAPSWVHGSSLFATDVLLSVVSRDIPFIEIPVTFRERSGDSAVLGNRAALARLALLGLGQILEAWIVWLRRRLFQRSERQTRV